MAKYTAHKDFTYSDANSLIKNLKKIPGKASEGEMYWKGKAIEKVAGMLRNGFTKEELDTLTFVPIPPSKTRDHAEYDDRLMKVLQLAFGNNADIRELVEQDESTESSHTTDVRPSPMEIFENLHINEDLEDGVRQTIVIFDDVVTNGAHFKAVRRRLKTKFPDAEFIGLFICRRETLEEIGEAAQNDFDEDLEW